MSDTKMNIQQKLRRRFQLSRGSSSNSGNPSPIQEPVSFRPPSREEKKKRGSAREAVDANGNFVFENNFDSLPNDDEVIPKNKGQSQGHLPKSKYQGQRRPRNKEENQFDDALSAVIGEISSGENKGAKSKKLGGTKSGLVFENNFDDIEQPNDDIDPLHRRDEYALQAPQQLPRQQLPRQQLPKQQSPRQHNTGSQHDGHTDIVRQQAYFKGRDVPAQASSSDHQIPRDFPQTHSIDQDPENKARERKQHLQKLRRPRQPDYHNNPLAVLNMMSENKDESGDEIMDGSPHDSLGDRSQPEDVRAGNQLNDMMQTMIPQDGNKRNDVKDPIGLGGLGGGKGRGGANKRGGGDEMMRLMAGFSAGPLEGADGDRMPAALRNVENLAEFAKGYDPLAEMMALLDGEGDPGEKLQAFMEQEKLDGKDDEEVDLAKLMAMFGEDIENPDSADEDEPEGGAGDMPQMIEMFGEGIGNPGIPEDDEQDGRGGDMSQMMKMFGGGGPGAPKGDGQGGRGGDMSQMMEMFGRGGPGAPKGDGQGGRGGDVSQMMEMFGGGGPGAPKGDGQGGRGGDMSQMMEMFGGGGSGAPGGGGQGGRGGDMSQMMEMFGAGGSGAPGGGGQGGRGGDMSQMMEMFGRGGSGAPRGGGQGGRGGNMSQMMEMFGGGGSGAPGGGGQGGRGGDMSQMMEMFGRGGSGAPGGGGQEARVADQASQMRAIIGGGRRAGGVQEVEVANPMSSIKISGQDREGYQGGARRGGVRENDLANPMSPFMIGGEDRGSGQGGARRGGVREDELANPMSQIMIRGQDRGSGQGVRGMAGSVDPRSQMMAMRGCGQQAAQQEDKEIDVDNASLDDQLQQLLGYERLKAHSNKSPRSDGMCTIIIIDTSASMQGDPITAAGQFISQFLNGLEEVQFEYDLEENVAVVCAGREVHVLQHLTTDYTEVRRAVDTVYADGPSPLHLALILPLSVLVLDPQQGRDYIANKNGHHICPRIILISDGHPTTSEDTPGQSGVVNSKESQMIQTLCGELLQTVRDRTLSEVYCVPVGNANIAFLEHLSKSFGGRLMNPSDAKQMSRTYLHHFMVGNLLASGLDTTNRSTVAALVQKVMACSDEADIDAVMKILSQGEPDIEGRNRAMIQQSGQGAGGGGGEEGGANMAAMLQSMMNGGQGGGANMAAMMQSMLSGGQGGGANMAAMMNGGQGGGANMAAMMNGGQGGGANMAAMMPSMLSGGQGGGANMAAMFGGPNVKPGGGELGGQNTGAMMQSMVNGLMGGDQGGGPNFGAMMKSMMSGQMGGGQGGGPNIAGMLDGPNLGRQRGGGNMAAILGGGQEGGQSGGDQGGGANMAAMMESMMDGLGGHNGEHQDFEENGDEMFQQKPKETFTVGGKGVAQRQRGGAARAPHSMIGGGRGNMSDGQLPLAGREDKRRAQPRGGPHHRMGSGLREADFAVDLDSGDGYYGDQNDDYNGAQKGPSIQRMKGQIKQGGQQGELRGRGGPGRMVGQTRTSQDSRYNERGFNAYDAPHQLDDDGSEGGAVGYRQSVYPGGDQQEINGVALPDARFPPQASRRPNNNRALRGMLQQRQQRGSRLPGRTRTYDDEDLDTMDG